MSSGNNIKVVCRFRPPNALELRENGEVIVNIDDDGSNVRLKSMEGAKGPEANGFTFDKAFAMDTQQESIFEYGVKDTVDDVIAGYNGTIFAYGQTGAGKSWTMTGQIDDNANRGLIPRIVQKIFTTIMQSSSNIEYMVKVAYMEIYLERIRDLLAPANDNLSVHEDKTRGVYVKNLSDYYVSSAEDVYEIMRQGSHSRAVTATNMNAESSRSHSIFVITVQQRNVETGTQKTGNLYLVDLAGSEKVGKTGASGQTLEEAKKINKSLSALGNVINALTDGKSSHVPYRDSKLTRILQESLGGNSRTTLIINCSPCAYNEPETLSTLRFGMRAKSIKNKARINAELSPAELKALLKKAQRDLATHDSYISLLETEVGTWRTGGHVEKADWASRDKVIVGEGAPPRAATPTSLPNAAQEPPGTPRSRPFTPASLLKDLAARPDTPSAAIEKDEREEFLKRENDFSDQLADKESTIASQEKLLGELREELSFFKEHEASLSTESKTMASEVNELKLQLEKLAFESKEAAIVADATKEQNAELTTELEEMKKQLNDLKAVQKNMGNDSKDKKKAEKLAALMGSFENGGATEKEEQIRATLRKLDEAVDSNLNLSSDDMSMLRRQFTEAQTMVGEQIERIRQAQDENEILGRRKDDLEARLAALEQEYEDLLDKTINDEDGIEAPTNVNELKSKLEAQYSAKRESMVTEISDLKHQVDIKTQEIRSLHITIESLKSANEELKRAFAATAAGIEGGKDLAESAKDMERIRKTMATQLADFDTMKKALMRDLQDRCEKVVELEISLDETREQYNNVLRNTNAKTQQRKMDFLTRNLDQLVLVQRQLVEQNTALKKDVSIAERKLTARNESIHNLEVMLQESQDKLDRSSRNFEEKMNMMRARLAQAQTVPLKQQQAGPLTFGSRIAVPLRGGAQAIPTVPQSPKRGPNRSSWFFGQ